MEALVVKRKWGAVLPFLFLALISMLWSSSALAEQKEWVPAAARLKAINSAEKLLSPFGDLAEVSQFLGSLPEDCEAVSDLARVCVWRRDEGQSAWAPLADMLETDDEINVICEFRERDGSGEESYCSAHPQRSNRDYFEGEKRKAQKVRSRAWRKEVRKHPDSEELRELYEKVQTAYVTHILQQREITGLFIANAKTGFEVSTVVGDIPVSCFEVGDEYICQWKTHAGTEGHGTLAWWIETDFSDKVRMTCRFPSNESPRAEGSCSAEVGD
ncbi:MAG: hypothetical protein VX252_11505 [Myxococcota bacterium]|nr:hypothetical protein [Myxococcota bacterium]